jgi:rhodanese-related sulfurtransferase
MHAYIRRGFGRLSAGTAVTAMAMSALVLTSASAQETSHAKAAADPTHAAAARAGEAQTFKTHVLTKDELDKLLAKPADILVIDVRRPDELTKIGGLPVYLSIQVADLEKSLAWIPKGRSIITVSNHAKRAGVAGDVLTAKGFKVAGAVGVQTYEEQGGRLTKVAVPTRQAASQELTAQ